MTEIYTEATLCFPVRGDMVLLARKQKKLGAGYLNGFGGKFEFDDCDIKSTNAREVEEEIGILIKVAEKVGEITFRNPSDDDELSRMIVHIFIATEWDGEPVETDEMKEIAWYEINNLDYARFLPADKLFLPQILGGKYVSGFVEYGDDWSVKESQISTVDRF